MIIKGLFRRYERWNPVHPTSGAFWGMGIGIGCGVGWGPGFGPEVVGYVGAGCGAGFSVGITLVGFGIGLPANYFYTLPYKAFMATKSGASEIAQISGMRRNVVGDGWCSFRLRIAGLQQKSRWNISQLRFEKSFGERDRYVSYDECGFSGAKPIVDHLERFRRQFFHPCKGPREKHHGRP